LYWMGNYTKFVNIERRFDDWKNKKELQIK
jgi:hypothetical protein